MQKNTQTGTDSPEKMYSDIMRYLHDIEHISYQGAAKTKRNTDFRNYYAAYMVQFVLINRMLDLARYCVYQCGYASQNEELKNKVVIKRLWDVGVIDEQTKYELLACIDARNKISHHFHECTFRDLTELYQKNSTILTCAELFKTHIDAHANKCRYIRSAVTAVLLIALALAFLFLY